MKLQKCYGNVSYIYISVPKWRPGLKMLRMKKLRHWKTLQKTYMRERAQLTGWGFLRTGVMKIALRKTLRRFILNSWIKYSSRFFACVCKQDGTDYEPGSLKVMQPALDRHLKEKGYSFSIIKDREFFNSRKVLEGKARELRNEGKGKLPNKSRSPTREEEEALWESGQLGNSSPRSLLNTIW